MRGHVRLLTPTMARTLPEVLRTLALSGVLIAGVVAVEQPGGEATVTLPPTCDIAQLTDLVARSTGVSFQFGVGKVTGSVRLSVAAPVTNKDLWSIYHQALANQGFTTVITALPAVYQVVPLADAHQSARVLTDEEYAQLPYPPGFQTVIRDLRSLSADTAMKALSAVFTTPFTQVRVMGPDGRKLLIAAPTQRISEADAVLRVIDQPGQVPEVRLFRPERTTAQALQASATGAWTALGRVDEHPRAAEVMIAPDGLQLMLVATATDIAALEKVARDLDRSEPTEVRTYRPKSFTLEDVASLIQQTLGTATKVEIVRDYLTGSLVIRATLAEHERIAAVVKSLDEAPASSRRQAQSLQVKHRRADEIARLVMAMISAESGAGGHGQTGAQGAQTGGAQPAAAPPTSAPTGMAQQRTPQKSIASEIHLDTAEIRPKSLSMPFLATTDSLRRQPIRLIFRGAFSLWAELRLPPDAVAGVSKALDPVNSGRGALVVPDHSAAASHAVDRVGGEAHDGFVRRCLGLAGSRQRPVTLPLVRSLRVVVADILAQHLAQTAITDEPQPSDALALDAADPALGKAVQIGAARRDGDRLYSCRREHLLPAPAELGIPVVDQIAAGDLLQPPRPLHGGIPSHLGHILRVGVLGDAQDLDTARRHLDGEQHIVGALAQPAPDIDREEIGSDQRVRLLGDESLPRPVGGALRCRIQAMAIEDGGDSACADGNRQLPQLALDALLTPGWVLRGHAHHQGLHLAVGPGAASPCPLQPELAGEHQSMPPADGRGLGHRGDLGEPLPSDPSRSPGQPLAPAIVEAQALARGNLLPQVADFSPQIGDLSHEGLVVTGQNGGGDKPGQEGETVHGSGQGACWSWVRNHVAGKHRRAA